MSHDERLFKLNWPSSIIICGPSKAGKTVFTSKFIRHIDSVSNVSPSEIRFYFSEYQPAYQEMACLHRVRFIQGLPDMQELKADSANPKLLILDDLMIDAKDGQLNELFTRGVHHWNCSVVFIVQNLFFGGRTARVNAHYLVLFKNPSDKLQVTTLAKQLYPKNSKYFMDAFQDATSQPFCYLFVDCSQTCPDNLRLRTNIFPGEVTFVYVP